jgi:hypothetical protein
MKDSKNSPRDKAGFFSRLGSKVTGFGSAMVDKVRGQDAFGQPVNMNFQGNDTYQTIPGGIISVVMTIMLIGYFLLKTKYMVFHEEWNLNNQIVMAET